MLAVWEAGRRTGLGREGQCACHQTDIGSIQDVAYPQRCQDQVMTMSRGVRQKMISATALLLALVVGVAECVALLRARSSRLG